MTANHRALGLLLLTLVVASIAAARLQLSYDLAAFLPPPTTSAQSLLTQRLGQGPGAQLIFIELADSSPGDASAVAQQLRQLPLVQRVLPEELVLSPTNLPEPIWRHRLLLGDLPDDTDSWLEVLRLRMDDLMFASDDDMLSLVAADPAMLSVEALMAFMAGAGVPAFDQGRTQYLIVETAVAGFDLTSQAQLVSTIRDLLSTRTDTTLLGSPVYAVDLQQSVRNEATVFSSLAGLALLLLMILRFKSVHRVIGVALPLAAGGAFGLLALTFAFDDIHGITLAFGFTLLGVAIDYPLHLYTHADQGTRMNSQSVWPVLRLGIFSTLIAYGAFIFSGTPGLQQLGVFAFMGISGAAVAAAWITRGDDHTGALPAKAPEIVAQHLRWWPASIVLLGAVALLMAKPIFNDDLSSLTPVDPHLLAADAQLRQQLGVTDIRYLVSVRAASEEQVLQASERALRHLAQLTESAELAGVQSIVQILPSRETQRLRRAHLRTQSHAAFNNAIAQSSLDPVGFVPFTDAIEQQLERNDYLNLAQLQANEQLRGAVNNLVFVDDGEWVSLLFLRGLKHPQAVAALFQDSADTQLVDLKTTSEQLVRNYRSNLLGLLLLALVLITALLSVRLNAVKSIWLILNAAAAVCTAAAFSALWQGGLSLFDLMALTLVAGLGLDYVLFYSRERSVEDNKATASAVLLCTISSLLVFSILSLSSIPVLRGIGTTVFIGVLAAYVLARFGRYTNTGS